jgi:hypothetical protein
MDAIRRPADGTESSPSSAELAFYLRLQTQALYYFLDNQTPSGLILDRQANHGPRRLGGLCSTAATGMGLIALPLASAEPYRLLSRCEAVARVRHGLESALHRLPHDHGILPHFLDPATDEAAGFDHCSTIDSAWLISGGLWAAAFLRDAKIEDLAWRLFDRVDWAYWAAPEVRDFCGLIRHGKDRAGRFLPCSWDRLNGETIFLYVLAAGAAPKRAWSPAAWAELRDFMGETAGLRFRSADLGLFVHQYGHDLLDLGRWLTPAGDSLRDDARRAARANERFCRAAAERFTTYRPYWGLSAGDGPGSHDRDMYRCYAPSEPLDGTAHLTAAAASVAHHPAAVWETLCVAEREKTLTPRGRYGFSSVNVDQRWVGRDMVGIDAGALVLALDNYLSDDRVRKAFHSLPCVSLGLDRIGFRRITTAPDSPPPVRIAS